MNHNIDFIITDNIIAGITDTAYKMNLLNKDVLSNITELDNSVRDTCLALYSMINNEHSRTDWNSYGYFFICAGMYTAECFINHIKTPSAEDIYDAVNKECIFQFTDIEAGSEKHYDFINNTNTLFTVARNLITENIQMLSPYDETIAERHSEYITFASAILMFRLGTAIRLQI